MTERTFLITGLLSLLPISELRGAIPYGIAKGMSVPVAYLYCVALNALVAPLVYLFLVSFHRLFSLMRWYRNLFARFIERARLRVQQKVDRFGYWGLIFFVALPLPITGAYTGTLGAWILGLDARRTFLAVLAGVMISGVIVTTVTYFGLGALSFLIKRNI